MEKRRFPGSSVHILLIALFGIIIYSNTLHVPFQFDDLPYIVHNQRIQNPENIPSLFTDIRGLIGPRPVTLTTFAVNYYFGGMNTFGYHLLNIALHVLSGILFYFLIMRTGRLLQYTSGRISLIALFSSLFLMSHPVQTECVTYITGRSTPLITVFYLSGILLFVEAVSAERRKALSVSMLFLVALAGMASRENFVTFPFMLVLYDLFFVSRFKVRRVLKNIKVHAAAMIPLAYFLYLVLTYDYPDAGLGEHLVSPLEYLRTQFSVHWSYLRLLALPINQSLNYQYSVSRTLVEFPTALSFLGYMGLWSAGLFLYRRRPVISFCILWFMITLSPVSSIIPLMNMIFEHRLYLPSLGFYVAVVTTVFFMTDRYKYRWPQRRRVPVALLAIITLVFSLAAYARNTVWQDEISLWEDATRKSPQRPGGHINLGNAYALGGMVEKAIKEYEIALSINPRNPFVYYNLGRAYQDKGLVDKAIEQYRTALKLKPDYSIAHTGLATALAGKGSVDKAIEHYKNAIRNPEGINVSVTHYNLGRAYQEAGLVDQAIEEYRKAIELDPDGSHIRNNLGRAYQEAGLLDEAIEEYRKAMELDPDGSHIRNNLGGAYVAKGLIDNAIEEYRTAIRLDPDNPQAHSNLGIIYHSRGRTDRAIEQFKISIRLDPDDPKGRTYLGGVYASQGLFEEAIDQYRVAIELAPDWELPHYDLGRIYVIKNDTDNAREEFLKVLQINPENREARRLLQEITR